VLAFELNATEQVGKALSKGEISEVRGHPHILDACSQYLDALRQAYSREGVQRAFCETERQTMGKQE
jgi:hypothetical protein